MPTPTGPTNPETLELVAELRKKKSPFHNKLAKYLQKPRRSKHGVTLFKINKIAQENDNVFVPSRVLSSGEMTKKVNVFAVSFAKDAEQKIRKAGCKAHSLREVLQSDAKGRI